MIKLDPSIYFNQINVLYQQTYFSQIKGSLHITENSHLWGIMYRDQLIAYIHIERLQNTNFGLLQALIVDKAHQSQHYAEQLLNHAHKTLTAFNINHLYCLTKYGANYLACHGYAQVIESQLPKALKDTLKQNHENILMHISIKTHIQNIQPMAF